MKLGRNGTVPSVPTELCWAESFSAPPDPSKVKVPLSLEMGWAQGLSSLSSGTLTVLLSDYMSHQDRPWVWRRPGCVTLDLIFYLSGLLSPSVDWVIDWSSKLRIFIKGLVFVYMHVLCHALSLPHHSVLLSSIGFFKFCPSNRVLERSWSSPLKRPNLPRLGSGDSLPRLTYQVPSVKIVYSWSSGFVAPSYPAL